MTSCAILFARGPSGGKVKTRLGPQLGEHERTALYTAFVADSAAILAASQAELKVIAYTPAAAEAEIRSLVEDASGSLIFSAQPEGDLGARMAHLMAWSRQQGAGRTVLIGSDSPSLSVSYVDGALELLRERDLVIGPSTDGGYYLIGQSAAAPAVFSGIEWSTGDVLEQTLAAAAPSSSLGLLPPWYDVDTPAEAAFLRAHLEALHRAGEPRARRSLDVLRSLALPSPS